MSKLRQAAWQALEALKAHATHHEHGCVYLDPAADALRAALAEPEQEPVAWVDRACLKNLPDHLVADARLIAAAPDLLKALYDLGSYADLCESFLRETHPGKAYMLRKQVTKAIAAMAKAKGEQ